MWPKSRGLILVGLLVLVFAPAYATTITTYSTLTDWQAATSSGYQTVDFEGLTAPGTSTYYYGGVSADGVQFIGYTSSGGSSIQVIDTSFSSWYNFGTGDALMQDMDRPNGGALPYIHIVLPAAITALGMDLFTVSPSALSYTITVAGNPYTVPTNPLPTTAFWGLTSDTPITSVDLTLAGTTYNGSSHALLDNFRFGTATGGSDPESAPEAGTYLLIGSGLIGLVLFRKRAQRE